jgi:hypothetical protein
MRPQGTRKELTIQRHNDYRLLNKVRRTAHLLVCFDGVKDYWKARGGINMQSKPDLITDIADYGSSWIDRPDGGLDFITLAYSADLEAAVTDDYERVACVEGAL